MEPVLQSALRRFVSQEHIRNLLEGEWSEMYDDDGNPLPGIRGRVGVAAMTEEGSELGIDMIEMDAGSRFPLHTHPGDHILYVLQGPGIVHVDGVDHPVKSGDSIFVAAEYAHGVKTLPDAPHALRFLAVGYPHKHVQAPDRMTIVEGKEHEHGHSHGHGHPHTH
jgi:quercetin dioxygenase-like cupin family protein